MWVILTHLLIVAILVGSLYLIAIASFESGKFVEGHVDEDGILEIIVYNN